MNPMNETSIGTKKKAATNGAAASETAAPVTKKIVSIERKKAFDWEGLKAKVEQDHWRKFKIVIQIREKMHAGKPAQLDAANAMLKARGLEEVVEAREAERPLEERVEETVDQGLCEFHRREGKPGLWWPSNNLKACFKENWSVLGYRKDATPRSKRKGDDVPASADETMEATAGEEGEETPVAKGKKKATPKGKTLQGSRGAWAEGVFVSGVPERDWILLSPNEEPDGVDTNVSHTTGPKGPQASIKRNEYLNRPVITAEIWIARAVADKIPDESFADMLIHAQEHGIGANRSQGIGKFDVVSVEEIE